MEKQETVQKTQKKPSGWAVFFGVVFAVLAINFLLNTFVLRGIEICGASMEPTFYDGEILYINRLTKGNRGDVIVISGEEINDRKIIKRYIAGGGDTVRENNGSVEVRYYGEDEFTPIENSALPIGATWLTGYGTDGYLIPLDEVFYLGDNRTNSHDSRMNDFKTCKVSQIDGAADGFLVSLKGFSTWYLTMVDDVRVFFGFRPTLVKNGAQR